MKWAAAFLFLLLLIPPVNSISIKELLARYNFFAVTAQMNVISYADFMVDNNNNGRNDTLVFELTTNNAAGSFIFAINLFDKDGTLVNETTKTLNAGANRINITFASVLLTQSQFNYSIKIYNTTHSLKYRRDNILTQTYSNYEEGFRVIDIRDSKLDKTLRINVTINSPVNGTHRTTLFLSYNNSIISVKEDKPIEYSINHLLFNFDNETIKRTHYIGNFTISSVKVGRKTIKTNFTTASYDFRDFAAKSYISGFADSATSAGNSKYDNLQINAALEIIDAGNYNLVLGLYDLFGNPIEQKNVSYSLDAGENVVQINVNGSKIYENKLNGPFIVKYAELYQNNNLVDGINDAYSTANYNFNDFDSRGLPDLKVGIDVSDGYHYGKNNITVNFTIKNEGYKPAFNAFIDIFDNKTFFQSSMSDVLNAGSQAAYQFDFVNISDFEISAIADSGNFVEESNESNNAERIAIKLNKPPKLASISNITADETDKITINLSASDSNGDNLSFSINLSRFSRNSNLFEWDTTTTESGDYAVSATASDGFLNDSIAFHITVLDAPEIDADNDGLNDSIDTLIGDESSVNTSTVNLTVFLDESRNLSKLFNGSRKVRFADNNLTIAEFEFDFSQHKLNLRNVTINKQAGNSTGSLIVRGLTLPEGATKTLYLDKINTAINGICIKEDEISAINEISSSCNLPNEFSVECDGTLQGSYRCTYNSTLSRYKVQGLRHSGIVQMAYTKELSESGSSSASTGSGGSSGSSGGGGGGSGSEISCISEWQCSEWSECIYNYNNRQCFDLNQCRAAANKPVEFKKCSNDKAKEADAEKNKAVSQINYSSLSSQFSGITGQVAKSIKQIKTFSDAIDIFAVILVLASSYLAIKSLFPKNL